MGLSIRKGWTAFDLCDAVIVPTTCDAKRKFGEKLSSFKDVWMLEVPHIKDADFSRCIWVEQMYALKSKIEHYVQNGRASRKITPWNLDDAIRNSARAQSEMRRLLSVRVSTIPVIWGRQAIAVANAYAYAPVKNWTRALVQLNHQLSEKAHQTDTVCAGHRPRIFIAGSPVIFPNMKVPSLVVAGIHQSLAKRIAGMARKAGIVPEILLTGGGGLNPGIAQALEEELLMDVHIPDYPQLNGAIGAALIGKSES